MSARGGGRILVVDDEPSMAQLVADDLGRRGHACDVRGSGGDALALAGAEPIDLVITDLNMPVMDGLELMKRIKQRDPGLPVIVITGYGTFHTERQVLSNGADGYIPKPCTINRVQETVTSALGTA